MMALNAASSASIVYSNKWTPNQQSAKTLLLQPGLQLGRGMNMYQRIRPELASADEEVST
jgi:hypothetical protein